MNALVFLTAYCLCGIVSANQTTPAVSTDVPQKELKEMDEMLEIFASVDDLAVGKLPLIVLIELNNMAREQSLRIYDFLWQYQVGLKLKAHEKKERGDIQISYGEEEDLYLRRLCEAMSKKIRKLQIKTTTTTPSSSEDDDEYDDSDDNEEDDEGVKEDDHMKFNRLKYKVDTAENFSNKLSILMELCEIYTQSKP